MLRRSGSQRQSRRLEFHSRGLYRSTWHHLAIAAITFGWQPGESQLCAAAIRMVALPSPTPGIPETHGGRVAIGSVASMRRRPDADAPVRAWAASGPAETRPLAGWQRGVGRPHRTAGEGSRDRCR